MRIAPPDKKCPSVRRAASVRFGWARLYIFYTVQLFQKAFLVFLIQILPLLAQFMFGFVGLALVLKPDYKFILKDQIIYSMLSCIFSVLTFVLSNVSA